MPTGVYDDEDLDALNDERNPARTHAGNPNPLSELSDEDIEAGLNKLEGLANGVSDSDPGGLFNAEKDKKDGVRQSRLMKYAGGIGQRLKSMSKTRKIIAGAAGGAAVVGLGAGMFSMFSFMNVFRLDHMMSNIEKKAFIRYQVDMEGRSSKWINAYIQLRMGQVEDPDLPPGERRNLYEDTLFRADRVDNNNPAFDWYRTMEASRFEQDLYEKHNIKFTSIARYDAERKMIVYRPGVITVGDQRLTFNPTPAEINAIENGDISRFNGRLREFLQVKEFGNDKDARRAIKQAVNDNTAWYRVMKRYYLRKSIQNMTGVRSWKFFEKTRNNLSEKKISMRNKIIAASLPESTKSGKFIQCLFGVKQCRASTDPADPENHQQSAQAGESCTTTPKPAACSTDIADDSTPDDESDTFSNGGEAEDGVRAGTIDVSPETIGRVALTRSILSKLNIATSVVSIVDTLNTIDKTMGSEALSKMVYMARATQAIGLYTTYSTARDQLRSGQLAGDDVGDFMKTVDGAGTSEGWDNVIDADRVTGTVSAASFSEAKNKREYCSGAYQDALLLPENAAKAESQVQYNCDSDKIGSTNTAETIQNGWNQSIGKTMRPVFAAYNGSGLSKVIGGINSAMDAVLGPILKTTLKGLGLDDDIKTLASWMVAKAASMLGAGPAVDPNAPSGVFVNHIIMGGAASAESMMRFMGGARTTTATQAATAESVLAYQQQEEQATSMATRYFSLANPSSLFSMALFNVSDAPAGNTVASLFGSLSAFPGRLVSAPASAAKNTTDGYSVSDFAGVNTYDFPKECLDADPLTMTLASSTNADDLGLIAPSDLSWEILADSDAFYGRLYTNNPDAGDKIDQVYDCAALDSSIRGALGAAYGVDLGPNALGSSGESDRPTTFGGSEFNITTLNIFHSDGQPDSVWKARLRLTVKTLKENDIDVAGLQEVRPDQLAAFKSPEFGGSTYDIFPNPKTATVKDPDFNPNPIIWNKTKYTMVKSMFNDFKYDGGTQQEPVIQLQDNATGQVFYVINTHHPADSRGTAQDRYDDAQGDLKLVNSLKGENLPIFLTGDFNSKYEVGGPRNQPVGNKRENLTYCILTSDGTLWDAYDADKNRTGTCPSTGTAENKNAIDHIFMSTSITDVSYKNLGDRGKNGTENNGSDTHDTIVAHVVIPAGTMNRSGTAPVSYKNPVFNGNTPDPSVIRDDDGTYHLYTTGKGLQHLTSTDLVSWTRVSGQVVTGAPKAATGAMWAPDVVKSGNNYIMTWSGAVSNSGDFNIFYAVGTAAKGPFKYRGMLVGGGYLSTYDLDPNIFMAPSGPILYYGSGGKGITAVPLEISTDGTVKTTGAGKNVLRADFSSEWIAEGAWMQKHGDYYYLYYSIGRYDFSMPGVPAYAVKVARAKSPMGPFEKGSKLLLQGDNKTTFRPGHNSIALDNAGNEWMIYHSYIGSNRKDRQLMIDPIVYGADGWPTVNDGYPSTTIVKNGPATGGSVVGIGTSGDTAAGGWVWPISSKDYNGLNQCWNNLYIYGRHAGLDIDAASGTTVYAAADGTVVWSKYDGAAGNNLLINTGKGVWFNYQHLESSKVSAGQKVKAGQAIALSGNTGRSSGPHLHFGVSVYEGLGSYADNSQTRDPLKYLPKDRDTKPCS